MQDAFFSFEQRNDRLCSGHLVLDVLVSAEAHCNLVINQAHLAFVIKADIIGQRRIFLKDRRKSHRRIQHSFSFDRKFFVLDHLAHLNAVEVRDLLLPVHGGIDKFTVPVKVDITVQITYAADRLSFVKIDGQRIIGNLRDGPSIDKILVLHPFFGAEDGGKHRVVGEKACEDHILHFFVCVLCIPVNFNAFYFIRRKKDHPAGDQSQERDTRQPEKYLSSSHN